MAKSLMIVDDSATMRKIIMRTVRSSGLTFDRIEEAGNGVEALQKLAEQPVDIILCDVNMPEMNGREMVKKVRADTSYQNIKIVMVSTESSTDFIEALMNEGADGYITKPFTPDRFSQILSPIIA